MDRWRAAGALLALAACFASSVAAPTSTNNHTALDLYDENTEGCYYNFQHYGEGDRIMTNEPCLNCTCHNRMLMCYLRVCPFTKAIGQDCTVEKRADQCCPIVTCPDVPVDLLTSTSTTSPAEYGGTGVGKVDNYGCTINGRYFSEGAKVPQTPGKPCEHCYCIRNMTTCVMQECTLHVDGCTPIYHKDVCCPVRYFCDHPEDEIPLLDDMTTTVRPTPGFLLTTTPASDIPTTTVPPRRDCIEADQLYPDGALIKTAKPCEHCYCMKGDIVCVVQECGTPMENEGKNCTSLPPREGQCCPDTYICEGDELSSEPTTELPLEELTTATPPRRVSVEGSGYRNEPDEVPYTEAPTFTPDVEGSGEDELEQKPLDTSDKLKPEIEPTEQVLEDKYGATEEGEFISKPTESSVPDDVEKKITDSDKESNTTPGEVSENYDTTESVIRDKTTQADELKPTEPSFIPEKKDEKTTPTEETTKPFVLQETTVTSDSKSTKSPLVMEETTIYSDTFETVDLDETIQDKDKQTESTIVKDTTTEVLPIEVVDDAVTKPSFSDSTTVKESQYEDDEQKNTVHSVEITTEGGIKEIITETSPIVDQAIDDDTRRKPTYDDPNNKEQPTSPNVVEEETSTPAKSLQEDKTETTESELMNDLNTVPVDKDEVQTTESVILDKTTTPGGTMSSEMPGFIEEGTTLRTSDGEISEPSVEKTTASDKFTIESQEQKTTIPTLQEQDQEDQIVTTEPAFRKEDEVTATLETITLKDTKEPTTISDQSITESQSTTPSFQPEKSDDQSEEQPIPTTVSALEQQEDDETKLSSQAPEDKPHQTKPPMTDDKLDTVTEIGESTTEPLLELSTFAHVDDKESSATTTFSPDKTELSETTVNPEDNEIAEVPSPGRIPGEGDCLLEGRTYKNESVVPSTNKCYTGCRCVSSIIKCDPIICSPPPEYMDNCQPTYDTPESCCPTYICDHGKETIPPQPHSQMSGTESQTLSPAIECNGDQCEIFNEPTVPEISSQVPDKHGDSDCGKEGCEGSDQKPIIPEHPEYPAGCTDDKCATPTEAEIAPPKEISPVITQDTPSQDVPVTSCKGNNEDDSCKIKPETPTALIPATSCEGDNCYSEPDTPSEHVPAVPCEGDNCVVKPDTPADHLPAAPCEGNNCEIKPETPADHVPAAPCEGDNCEIKPETPTDHVPAAPCEEDSCKIKPETPTEHVPVTPCEGDNCQIKPETPTEHVPAAPCEGDNCENKAETPEDHVPAPPCEGDDCQTKLETPTDHVPAAPCEGDNCEIKPETPADHVPAAPCEGDNCEVKPETPADHLPAAPCEGDNCEIKPETPADHVPAAPCEGDNCKIKPETPADHVPAEPCEGNNCEVKPETPADHVPAVPCEGDNCEVKPETPADHVPVASCEGNNCEVKPETPADHVPVAPCEGDNCEIKPETPADHVPAAPCEEDSCKIKPETPTEHVPVTPCEGDNCQIKPETPTEHVPAAPCEGDNCVNEPAMPTEPTLPARCEGDNCEIKPETPADHVPSTPCEGDSCEIKPEIPTKAETPQSPAVTCDGNNCEITPEIPTEHLPTLCEGDNCEIKPNISTDVVPEICGNQDECKQVTIPDSKIKPECSDSDCLQQKPDSPAGEISPIESLSTDLPITATPIYEEGTKQQPESTFEPTESSISDFSVLGKLNDTRKHEPAVSDEEQKATKAPEEIVTEFTTTAFIDKQPEPEEPHTDILSTTQSVTDMVQELSTQPSIEANPEEATKTPEDRDGEAVAQDEIESKPVESKPTEEHSLGTTATNDFDDSTETVKVDAEMQPETVTNKPEISSEQTSESSEELVTKLPETTAESDSKATVPPSIESQKIETKAPETSEIPDEPITEGFTSSDVRDTTHDTSPEEEKPTESPGLRETEAATDALKEDITEKAPETSERVDDGVIVTTQSAQVTEPAVPAIPEMHKPEDKKPDSVESIQDSTKQPEELDTKITEGSPTTVDQSQSSESGTDFSTSADNGTPLVTKVEQPTEASATSGLDNEVTSEHDKFSTELPVADTETEQPESKPVTPQPDRTNEILELGPTTPVHEPEFLDKNEVTESTMETEKPAAFEQPSLAPDTHIPSQATSEEQQTEEPTALVTEPQKPLIFDSTDKEVTVTDHRSTDEDVTEVVISEVPATEISVQDTTKLPAEVDSKVTESTPSLPHILETGTHGPEDSFTSIPEAEATKIHTTGEEKVTEPPLSLVTETDKDSTTIHAPELEIDTHIPESTPTATVHETTSIPSLVISESTEAQTIKQDTEITPEQPVTHHEIPTYTSELPTTEKLETSTKTSIEIESLTTDEVATNVAIISDTLENQTEKTVEKDEPTSTGEYVSTDEPKTQEETTKMPEKEFEPETEEPKQPEVTKPELDIAQESATTSPQLVPEDRTTINPEYAEDKTTDASEITPDDKPTENPIEEKTTKASERPIDEMITDVYSPQTEEPDTELEHDVTEKIKEDITRSPDTDAVLSEQITDAPETKLPEISRTSLPESSTEPHKLDTEPSLDETISTKSPFEEEPETHDKEVPTTKVPEIDMINKETDGSVESSTAQQEISSTSMKEVTESQEIHTESLKPTDFSVSPTEYSTVSAISEDSQQPSQISTESFESGVDKEPVQTSKPELEYSETTPFLVELEEHTHKLDDEISTELPIVEPTTDRETYSEEPVVDTHMPSEKLPEETQTDLPVDDQKTEKPDIAEKPQTTESMAQIPEQTNEIEPIPDREVVPEGTTSLPTTAVLDTEHDKSKEPALPGQDKESTPIAIETEKPEQIDKEVTAKPQEIPETTAPEEEFIAVTTKSTTRRTEEEPTTPPIQLDKFTKPEDKPYEVSSTTILPEVSKPEELQPTDEIPSPEDDSHFPPTGGYNQEPDYVEEDQAFGPGTCRYGGKVYVSAQQIPRDDPCDFCFCFRSDIICLQQSCPPPIHGCHEEPIQGFCCPRYECPVSMATTLNVTTTTTTTTTTLPPHFLPHAYKGAAQRRGCQIKGHTYKVGEVVRASSGPCLHCTCGGDGQMKCDPKACTPEPMLRQMIAAAVSAKRRR